MSSFPLIKGYTVSLRQGLPGIGSYGSAASVLSLDYAPAPVQQNPLKQIPCSIAVCEYTAVKEYAEQEDS